jgi:23S rRNA (adenine2503-C2)-methyltransferase
MPAVDLLTFSSHEMAGFIHQLQWPRYRATQVLRWLYQSRLTAIEAMTDLSQSDRAQLAERATIGRLEPADIQTAPDGTKKFLFSLADGRSIESVVIPDEDRLTLCLSTQVGCTLDCAFCLTGRMGLVRNLLPHEIIGQALAVQRHLGAERPLTNMVLMGMGEPLANLDAVEEALRRLTNVTWGMGFSARRITLSTAGLASRIKRVAEMGVNLAVSLNATTNAQRDRLMPAANHAHSLDRVLDACRTYPLKPRRRLTFEYVLLKDENDSERDALRLVRLVRGIRCKINLIPFNEFPNSPFRRPSDDAVLRFQHILTTRGLDAFIRKSKGREILGACGQLRTPSESAPLLVPRSRRSRQQATLQPAASTTAAAS